MNQPNFYDFGFDSSNSSSTLTLKFDECEAITESSTLMSGGGGGGAGGASDPYNTGAEAAAAEQSVMMDSLRDNPVLTTASMPIPTRNAINQNACRLPMDDFGLDFDLSQDLNMPQILLMDGTDLANDDSSPTLFGLGHHSHSQYTDNSNVSCGGPVEHTRPIDVVASIRGDFGMQTTSHGQQGQQQHQQGQQQSPHLQSAHVQNHHHHHHHNHHHLLSTEAAGHQMWGSDANSHLSSSSNNSTTTTTNTISSGNAFIAKSEPLNLDDDAIYQVDKADLIQGKCMSGGLALSLINQL